MPAYNFAGEHIPAIRSGEKTLTLREPRKTDPRHSHARVGGRVQITTWNTCTKSRSQLFERRCILRAHLVLGPHGLVRVTEVKSDLNSETAYALRNLLTSAEQGSPDAARWSDRMAHYDGFADYAALYAWHAANGSTAKPDADGLIRRELIAWGTPA